MYSSRGNGKDTHSNQSCKRLCLSIKSSKIFHQIANTAFKLLMLTRIPVIMISTIVYFDNRVGPAIFDKISFSLHDYDTDCAGIVLWNVDFRNTILAVCRAS